MKNLLCILCLCLYTITFSSCGEDADASSGMLEGTWTAEDITSEVETTTQASGETFSVTSSLSSLALDYDLTFEETTFTTSGSYTFEVVSKFSDTTSVTSEESKSNVSGSGSYSVDGMKLTIDGALYKLDDVNQQQTATTGPQIVDFVINDAGDLVMTNSDTQEINQGGLAYSLKVTSRSVWKRK